MIMVFRAGDSHEFKGIKCELKRIENWQLNNYLELGWLVSPPDSQEIQNEPIAVKLNDTRAVARSLGIEGWRTRRFSTLRDLINDAKNRQD